MSSKKDQFLNACRNQKLDTVRWGIGAGGQQPSSRDEHGFTALMICASLNKHKAVQMLCDWCRRSRMKEQLDLTDGEGNGTTALMMAAKFGHEESCRELLDAGRAASGQRVFFVEQLSASQVPGHVTERRGAGVSEGGSGRP